jgi:hypothetical protein
MSSSDTIPYAHALCMSHPDFQDRVACIIPSPSSFLSDEIKRPRRRMLSLRSTLRTRSGMGMYNFRILFPPSGLIPSVDRYYREVLEGKKTLKLWQQVDVPTYTVLSEQTIVSETDLVPRALAVISTDPLVRDFPREASTTPDAVPAQVVHPHPSLPPPSPRPSRLPQGGQLVIQARIPLQPLPSPPPLVAAEPVDGKAEADDAPSVSPTIRKRKLSLKISDAPALTSTTRAASDSSSPTSAPVTT